MAQSGTSFSQAAVEELHVVEDAIRETLSYTERAFAIRSEKDARKIEPMVQIVSELNAVLRRNHLRRMSLGRCNVYADSSFSNLGVEFRRIAAVCSNELTDHEHLYFESLHNGSDEEFNRAYEDAYARYFRLLEEAERPAPDADPTAEPTQV